MGQLTQDSYVGIQNENSDLWSEDVCPDSLDRGSGISGVAV